MNKILAILFLLGAIASFGLSQQRSYLTQDRRRVNAPVGAIRTTYVTSSDKIGYIVIGVCCMTMCLYNVAKIRH